MPSRLPPNDRSPVMAPIIVECLIVLTNRHGPTARLVFDRLRSEISLGAVVFTQITPQPHTAPTPSTARAGTPPH